MPDLYWCAPVGGAGFPTAGGASFGTFTTFQDISPTPIPLIFGGQLRLGSVLELEAEGEFSTTGTPTLSIGFYYGTAAVVLAASAAITTGTGAAAWPFHIKWRGRVTTQGASGNLLGQGTLDLGTSLVACSNNAIPNTAAARNTAVDTTTNKVVGIGAAWGTSSASNTIKVNNYTATLLN